MKHLKHFYCYNLKQKRNNLLIICTFEKVIENSVIIPYNLKISFIIILFSKRLKLLIHLLNKEALYQIKNVN